MRPSPDPLPLWVFPPPQSAWTSWGRNALLLALTALSMYAIGGPRLVVGMLGILLAHEMGHYVACRIYRVDATLPFFLPCPWIPVVGAWVPLSPVGTFGAFIRIRGPIPHRRALFDIGIAGPLAGFVVCLLVLTLGLVEAEVRPRVTTGESGITFGEPLLLRWTAQLVLGDIPSGNDIYLGPLGLAAWFGLFVTAINLIPVGQLDGGHVMYALLRDRAIAVSRWGWWVCVALIYFSPSWILWAVLLRLLGRRHPRTLNDHAPIGSARVALGVFGYLVLVICFVPEPVLGSWDAMAAGLDELIESILH